MKKFVALTLALVLACTMFAFAKAEDGKITVGLVVGYRRDEFYMDLESRFKVVAAEKGWDMLAIDTDFDNARAVAAIEDYVASGVDAIITWGSGQMVSAVEAAVAQGIPVVCYDGSCPSDQVTANVTYDPISDGTAVGGWAKAYIEEHWPEEEVQVAILDFPASSEICVGRTNAFKAVIETIPNAKIVAQMDGKASRADSMAALVKAAMFPVNTAIKMASKIMPPQIKLSISLPLIVNGSLFMYIHLEIPSLQLGLRYILHKRSTRTIRKNI